MARTLFARGAKGELISELQRKLGMTNATGNYFDQTVAAVKARQEKLGHDATGVVDFEFWPAVMEQPVPPVFARSLQLTAAFEGTGFQLAEGNFDGAGVTWGLIGFTLVGGELKRVFDVIAATVPQELERCFGPLLPTWKKILAASKSEQIAFANSISKGKSNAQLAPEWLKAFNDLGAVPEVQQIQFARARDVYKPLAESIAAFCGFTSELGFALAFDIAVQNSFDDKLKAMITAAFDSHPLQRELDRRVLVAHAVAEHARKEFQQDVLTRKLLLATGSGIVHGQSYVLTSWGLDDV